MIADVDQDMTPASRIHPTPLRMKTNPALVTLLLAFVASLAIPSAPCFAQPGQRRPAARYGWLSNYQQGIEQARKQKKPLMLVFRCVP